MKDEQWKAAMEEYKAAGDKLGYSSAFVKYRYTFIRKFWMDIAGSWFCSISA